jgi:hypothetical protein
MTRADESGARLENKAAWSVVVVYEDSAARERAVTFCDQLVGRFWERFEFDIGWWSFDMLGDSLAAAEAARKAEQADLLVFSATPEGEFPAQVEDWVETWLTRRGDSEGVLAGLLEPAESTSDREDRKHIYLRNTAHRGAMDYVTHLPQDLSRSIPDSIDSYAERADQVTSLLVDILHQQQPPPPLLP